MDFHKWASTWFFEQFISGFCSVYDNNQNSLTDCLFWIKVHFQLITDKNKGQNTQLDILTKPYNGPSCFHVPLQITLTKGEGQAVAPSVSTAVGNPSTNTCCSVRPYASQRLLPKHTDTPRRVFVLVGSHTPHHQLRRYVTVHCEDWGKVPRPATLPPHWLIGWHLDQLSGFLTR